MLLKQSVGVGRSAKVLNTDECVTIIIPTLNEEAYIAQAIESLICNDPDIDYEILVFDGGSTDKTCDIVQKLSSSNPSIKLLHNERRIQAAATNLGCMVADPRSKVIVRADCHAEYPQNFAVRLVHELRRTRASSVVVPMRTIGRSPVQRAIAAAQNSRLGNGGALHRSNPISKYVDHGHHAAFDRNAFVALGGYDETFSHNEDAELDLRILKSGRTIWLCAELTISYFPRSSFRSLACQYFNFGSGRAKTALKHQRLPRPRQAIPAAILITTIASLLFGMMWSSYFLIPIASYVLVCLGYSTCLAVRSKKLHAFGGALAAIIMHHSWAAGFFFGLGHRLIGHNLR